MRRILPCLLCLLWMARPAVALDGNDMLVLELADGRRIEGWYHGYADGLLRLSGPAGFQRVPVALVKAVWVDGQPSTLEELHRELEQARQQVDALRSASPPGPRPGLVIGLSLAWPGAGHAALGDWGAFGAYSLAEGMILGVAGWSISQRQPQVLLPLVGLDLLMRGWSAGESARVARRRQAHGETGALGAPDREGARGGG